MKYKNNPSDILETISNLSNDEVFTPPSVANEMLDQLPKEIWTNPNIKILDPCSKTGIFLRESAKRLYVGLEKEIPDEKIRRDHIFINNLYGIPITELTSLISRRTLYYSKDASSEYSVTKLPNKHGNLYYERSEHDFFAEKCRICGAVEDTLGRGEKFENYAYPFLHNSNIYSDMKFDVVIGNPPYQLDDGGFGRSASPIYNLFVEQAFKLKPRYVCMIIPSRWFSGGKGLKTFRENMLQTKNLTDLVDYPNSEDVFPNVTIRGGVSYFLWDKNYEGKCHVKTFQNGELLSESKRYLGEHGDIFVRNNESLTIINKIDKKSSHYMDELISVSNPFGMRTNFENYTDKKTGTKLKLYTKFSKTGYVHPKFVTKNEDLIYKYKVITLAAYGTGGKPPYKVMGNPIIAKPGEVCSETYIVCGSFNTLKEAKNLEMYMSTKFFRFLVFLRTITQHIKSNSFKFVPIVDFHKEWTDKDLYKYFKLTDKEIDLIENTITQMS